MSKVNIPDKAKVLIEWRVKPVDYSHEKKKSIIGAFAKKYDIEKSNVSVEAKLIKVTETGEEVPYTNDVLENIQDFRFQQKLFKDYLIDNNVENYDLDKILDIDNQMNGLMDYNKFDNYRRYKLLWLKWSNFLSYGSGNEIDFTKLNGLVLLSGVPQNQSGKSTISHDGLHFLLFGKTSKSEELADMFNLYRPEETEVVVEGGLMIDGEEYVIRRTLSRPALKRRTASSKVTQKIEYFKRINGEDIELAEENQAGDTSVQTNKIIREAIGNEQDFDLIVSANSDSLNSLISLKNTARGNLLMKWIGLLPLEEKDAIAREKYNKQVVPSLMSTKYNRSDLTEEIETLKNANIEQNNVLKSNDEKLKESENKIKGFEKEKEELLLSKNKVDEKLLKVDVETINKKIEQIIVDGKNKKAEKELKEKELLEVKDVVFSEEEYKKLNAEDKAKSIENSEIKTEITRLKNENIKLKNSEVCPTCKRKLDGVDYSQTIAENEKEIEKLTQKGVKNKEILDKIKEDLLKLEQNREKYNRKLKTELLIDKIVVDLETLTNKYKENNKLKKEFEDNKEAIKKNNEIDNKLNINQANLKTEQTYRDSVIRDNEKIRYLIDTNIKSITEKEKIIELIIQEESLIRNWKIYLELVGKNGISKMVLRNTLPIINVELERLLNGVCDFTVEVVIDDNNDVKFYLIRNETEIKTKLMAASGFEKTAASLALRTVLANISNLPKPNFCVFDEILSGVAQENYENMKQLYDKISQFYSFILHITHNKLIEDWHDSNIRIEKNDNISKIITN
jgi:DNA repair exonuclease SbcCD ATPase subunit